MCAKSIALQELPKPALLKAIAKCGNTGTAADVAAAAGQDLAETRRQLLVLARLVGAELQVSEEGELLFVFEEPDALKRSLRVSSVRQRVNDAWTTVSPPLFWLLRASFGIGLIASLVIVTTGITVLSQSKDERSENSPSLPVGRMLGPSPFDFLYYSTRPYGYGYGYGYGQSEEKGFLQSCFSFLFGDGDPNADFTERTSAAAAAVIRANGGAVTAEQLAPLLAPSIDPDRAAEDAARPGAPVSEGWMLPILLQFNGEPKVTDNGDLVYIFPELMASADVDIGQQRLMLPETTSLSEQVAFIERPAAWRPAVGERVVIKDINENRPVLRRIEGRSGPAMGLFSRRDDIQECVGMEGTVVIDERDRFPLGVSFDGQQEPNAYFKLDELLPAGADEVGLSLRELPQRFSTAPTSQLVFAGVLGAANLAAVVYLGNLLAPLAGVPAANFGDSAGLISLLRTLYTPLLVYATGFAIVPAVRAFIVRQKNRAIQARNAVRESWGRALGSGSLAEVVKRKIKAAKSLRPKLQRVTRDSQGQFSTSRDLAEYKDKDKLPGSSFDDFDARLAGESETNK